MQVQFWGAAQTITGSMHLVEYEGKRVLLDCGLYQGRRKEAFNRNRDLPFDARSIDAVLLSHAHIDHSGNLPSLIRHGFKGRIYTTPPTKSLAVHMLLDSAQIQESDVKYVNKKRKQKQQSLFDPLYVQEDAVRTLNRMVGIDFAEPFQPVPGMTCRFHVAGHMLGAAHVELTMSQNGHPPIRLAFSGDIGRKGAPILKDPTVVEGVDYLIMEATYGNRKHPEWIDAEKELHRVVQETWDNRGKLIVPAFSVGRTQEIIYRLNNLKEAGKLPPLKVFLDSPLAIDAHTVFQQYFDQFDDTFAKQILSEEDEDPLDFHDLYLVRKVQHSMALNKLQEPCIIISASGMCESGRILHHLKQHISNPTTTVLLTGYQAPYTLGRRLEEGAAEVNIFGDPYKVRAKILKLQGSSGHADQPELIEWASNVAAAGNLKKVALVHCELENAQVLSEKLLTNDIRPVIIPDRGETMPLAE